MPPEDVRWNRKLAVIVLASLLILVTAVVLRIGIGNTDFETTDSMGRPMGFNDPLSAEHHWIMVQNFHPADLFKAERIYDWILLLMHAGGAWLLLSASYSASRLSRWFFAAQPIVFPIGLLLLFLSFLKAERFADWIPLLMHIAGAGLLLSARYSTARLTRWSSLTQPIAFPIGLLLFSIPFHWIYCMLTGNLGDREGFVDIPYTAVVSQPTWVASSLIIFFAMRGPGLGFAKVWGALKDAGRVGTKTFVAAVR